MPELRRQMTDADKAYLRFYRAIWRYSLPTVLAVLAVVLLFVDRSVMSGLALLCLAAYFVPAVRTFRKRLPSVCNVLLLLALLAGFYFSMYLYI